VPRTARTSGRFAGSAGNYPRPARPAVEARGAQLFAHFPARLSLAHLAIPSAITLTLLAQSILVFTGEPQLLALAAAAAAAAIIQADAAGSI